MSCSEHNVDIPQMILSMIGLKFSLKYKYNW